MGEEGIRVTGGAEGDVGFVCHCVILNVLWEKTTLLQEDPKSLKKRVRRLSAMLQNGIPSRMTNKINISALYNSTVFTLF